MSRDKFFLLGRPTFGDPYSYSPETKPADASRYVAQVALDAEAVDFMLQGDRPAYIPVIDPESGEVIDLLEVSEQDTLRRRTKDSFEVTAMRDPEGLALPVRASFQKPLNRLVRHAIESLSKQPYTVVGVISGPTLS